MTPNMDHSYRSLSQDFMFTSGGLQDALKDIHYLPELIENKSIGIFDILDEESKLPKPTHDHFTGEVHKKNKNHYRISVSGPEVNQLPSYGIIL